MSIVEEHRRPTQHPDPPVSGLVTAWHDATTIMKLWHQFEAILRRVAEHADTRLAELAAVEAQADEERLQRLASARNQLKKRRRGAVEVEV